MACALAHRPITSLQHPEPTVNALRYRPLDETRPAREPSCPCSTVRYRAARSRRSTWALFQPCKPPRAELHSRLAAPSAVRTAALATASRLARSLCEVRFASSRRLAPVSLGVLALRHPSSTRGRDGAHRTFGRGGQLGADCGNLASRSLLVPASSIPSHSTSASFSTTASASASCGVSRAI